MKCCEMTAGKLRSVAVLSRRDDVVLPGGSREKVYQEYATVRCQLISASGREVQYADRLDAQTSNRMVMRYRDYVTESDRVEIDGRTYNIRFINNVEQRNRWLEIVLDGGVAA